MEAAQAQLAAAILAVVDARLLELGLTEEEAEAEIEKQPAKSKSKGKDAAPPPKAAVGDKKGKKGKKAPTFDELKAKLMELVKEKSKDAAVAALARQGAKKLTEIAEDDYGTFGEYLDQCIAGEIDPEEAEEAEDLLD